MRKRKFAPSIEIMGLRLAPSGALPIDFTESNNGEVQVSSSPGNVQMPIASPPNDLCPVNIPPVFYMDVATVPTS